MKLLVIEDDNKISTFLSKGLKEAGFTVDLANDGESGIHLLTSAEYNLVILDLMLPNLDGISVLNRMRALKIETPVIILSAKQSVDDRVKGLQDGADDYLVKPFSFNELLARVQALLRRGMKTGKNSTLQFEDLELDLIRHEFSRESKKIELHPKEFLLLEYFMQNPQQVLTKTQILEKVWGYDFDPQTNVVDVLVCRLRNKIDRDFETKTIHTIRSVGYVLRKD